MSDLFDGEPLAIERDLREIDIQSKCIDFARRRGAYCRKFSSPANRSVPDYVIGFRDIVVFVEFKRPGKVATTKQREEHELIRAQGLCVITCDSVESFKKWWGGVFF